MFVLKLFDIQKVILEITNNLHGTKIFNPLEINFRVYLAETFHEYCHFGRTHY